MGKLKGEKGRKYFNRSVYQLKIVCRGCMIGIKIMTGQSSEAPLLLFSGIVPFHTSAYYLRKIKNTCTHPNQVALHTSSQTLNLGTLKGKLCRSYIKCESFYLCCIYCINSIYLYSIHMLIQHLTFGK